MSSPRAAFAFVFCVFVTTGFAFQQPSSIEDALPSPSASNDLIATTNGIIHHSLSSSMRDSLKTLRDLETAPSCNKVAAAALIHSCSTLDGSVTPTDDDITRGPDFIVHEEINVYAARLAVCELNSAQASVPHACAAFVPTIKTAKKRSWAGYLTGDGPTKPRQIYPEYDQITEDNLAQCLSALHDSNQAWTSFTASKQNAGIMCHSMRAEVERDIEIHLHKVLASTTEQVVDALLQSKKDWMDFKADFTDLASNMRETHLDLVQDDEQRLETARRSWAEWQAGAQAGLQDISTGIQDIRSDVDNARESLRVNLQHVDNALEQTAEQITDLATHHVQELRGVSEETVALVDLLQFLSEVIQQSVVKGIYNASQSLQIANTMAYDISGTLGDLALRLDRIEEAADNADRLNTSLGSLSDVLNGNWIGAIGLLETAAAFVGYAVVFSLLSVGIWQRIMPFPGNVCASLASGLVCAYVSTFYFGPVDALRCAFGLVTTIGSMRVECTPTFITGFIATGIIFNICICRLLFGHWLPRLRRQAHEDVESFEDTKTVFSDRDSIAFRLPINDPRRVAEMAERRAMREAGGARGWEV